MFMNIQQNQEKMHHTKQERPSLPDVLEKRLHCDLSHLPRIPKKPGTSRPPEEASSSKEDMEGFDPADTEVSSKSTEASQETSTVPKNIPRVTSAPGNIFDNMEDSFGYLGSITLDSDSDDEDLQQTPLALRKCLDGLEDAGSRPVPGTPSKYEVLQDEGDDSLSDDIDSITGKDGDLKPYHYTIDKLLDEKRQQEYREHRIVTLEEQLKAPSEESLDGSFDGEAAVDDSQASSNLMPQHLETLRRLELKSESISDFHPGELVLDPAKYGCLFHYPGNLTLASCGFEPGSSRIDQNLHNLSISKPELALDFMTGDIVSLCFDAISCPHAFLSWLFHLVSIVPYSLIAMGVHKLLYEQLCREDGDATTWVPSVKEVTRVLVNYGACLSDICPDPSLLTFQEEDLSLPPGEPPAGQGGNQPPGGSLRKENLEIVTETLTAAIHKRPDCYNSQELTALFLMMCKLSLEEHIRIHMVQHTLKLCLAAILDAYLDEDFGDQVSYLSENVPSLASHHHNKVYLVQLMPYTSRGLHLQRRLAYHTLVDLTDVSSIQEQPKMENLCTLVRALNIQQETDYYHLHSVLQLVDIGVGNEPLRGADRPFLKDLMDSLLHLKEGVRDTIQDLDRTKVKDLMVRISTKWQLLIQNTGLQQQGIYTWAQQKQQPPPSVQHVVLQPEEEEEDEDDLEDPTAPD